jgi:hypothetical protein
MTEFIENTFFQISETEGLSVPIVSYDEFNVPLAFLRNCGTWEGTARRISAAGELIDTDIVRVKIEIDGSNYVQTNTVRINTPKEVTAKYYGNFSEGKLVFPITDEVYTLGGEKASAFSGIAWAITDELIVYRGSRTLRGIKTFYNELIALVDKDHRVRTTQLYEDGVYKLVTMIEESKLKG